jgi:hypothetical protein
VDGITFLRPSADPTGADLWSGLGVGSMVRARVVASAGVDVIAELMPDAVPAAAPAGPTR